jgi:hypothetical protein
MKSSCWLSALVLLTTVGCSSTQLRTYDISIANHTDTDVTAWITKSESLTIYGGPFEATWASPEEVEQEPPREQALSTDIVIPPGKTATVHPSGDFDPSGDAYLRIYRATTLEAILGLDRGSRNRADLVLEQGRNVINVFDQPGGRLTAVPVER